MKIRVTGLMVTKVVNNEYDEQQSLKNVKEFLKKLNISEEPKINKVTHQTNLGVAELNQVVYEPFTLTGEIDLFDFDITWTYDRIDMRIDNENLKYDDFKNDIGSYNEVVKKIFRIMKEEMLFERLACEIAFESKNGISRAIIEKYNDKKEMLQAFLSITDMTSNINKVYSIRQEHLTKELFDVIEFNSNLSDDFSTNLANVDVFINDFELTEMIEFYEQYN